LRGRERPIAAVRLRDRQSLTHGAFVALRWHILTGEYPPQRGGVADYTRLVARALAEAGDQVCVWAPFHASEPEANDGIQVRRLADNFGPLTLTQLDREFSRNPGRVLLQYTPHAFGWKAMNVPLCMWLYGRRRTLDVMFHEVAFPWEANQPYKHQFLAMVQRGMAALLVRGAQRIFVSIPGWKPLLDRLAPRSSMPEWMPVPSNLPMEVRNAEVADLRQQMMRGGCTGLVGHFGTYGPLIAELLQPALVHLLEQMPAIRVLLLGHGSPAFAARLLEHNPEWTARLGVRGELDERALGAHLASCDVLLQPYPDGISTRRGSAMAGIALGLPLVTTEGHLTEPLWRNSGAVAFAAAPALADAVQDLLADAPRRAQLGRRASALYRERFAVEHTIRLLRQAV